MEPNPPTPAPDPGPPVGIVRTPDGHSVPKLMDPLITMGAIQKYVEAERNRNRRVILGLLLMFVCAGLAMLALFAWVGVTVLRQSRNATEIVEGIEAQTAILAVETVGISNRVSELQTEKRKIEDLVRQAQQRQDQEKQRVYTDLQRFGQWVDGRIKGASQGGEAEAALREVEELKAQLARKEDELAQVRDRFESLSGMVTGLAAQVEMLRAVPAPAPVEPVPLEEAVVIPLPATSAVASAGVAEAVVFEDSIPRPEVPASEVSTVAFRNGDRYEGQFKQGLFHGWGVLTTALGDRYEGEFRNDVRYGRGTLVYANGDRYIGDFKENVRQGSGTMFFKSGERYKGAFVQDRIEGAGVMQYANGNVYTGEFRNGVRDGRGRLAFFNGDMYEGDFREDLRTGKGVYRFADGAQYVGEFINGVREGQGRYIYASGEEYEGEFKAGRKHGRGTVRYPNGQELAGVWEDDQFVAPTE